MRNACSANAQFLHFARHPITHMLKACVRNAYLVIKVQVSCYSQDLLAESFFRVR